jgi:hypothetical protein
MTSATAIQRAANWKQAGSLALVLIIWLATTYVFWVGYAGFDDMGYARYAFLFHRPPNHWLEFRIPAILAIRASFLAFGASEFTATLPELLASLMILAAVAWLVDWPRKLAWQSQAAVLIAATLPFDVTYRSTPGATHLAGALVTLGTVCILKGSGWVRFAGSALFAAGFATHESMIFYVGIFCLTALAFDRRRYWRPVLLCIVLSASFVVVEGAVYRALLGDFLARFKMAASESANIPFAYDPDTHLSGVRFFMWPLNVLLFTKVFGFDLVILLVAGAWAWRSLTQQEQILYTVTFLTWAWLGYGTKIPWAYRPLFREMHFYVPLVLSISVLLPTALAYVLRNRHTVAPYVAIAAILATHLGLLAGGGRWGQRVVISRQLLRYAEAHKQDIFVTDVTTMNHMYAVGGFRIPENVICINGPAVEGIFRVNNIEPPGRPRFRFPERAASGILLNLEVWEGGDVEPEFVRFVKDHEGIHRRVVPVRYKLLFLPLLHWIAPKGFMIRSPGAEVVQFDQSAGTGKDKNQRRPASPMVGTKFLMSFSFSLQTWSMIRSPI